MSNPSIKETFEHNGQTYLSLLRLRESKCNPQFFRGRGNVGVNVRPCIKLRGIAAENIVWVFLGQQSKETNKKAQPYVAQYYADECIRNVQHIQDKQATEKAGKKAERDRVRVERKAYDPSELQPLPELVELSDAEMFRDTSGNVLAIEVRGEKTTDGLYFKALDIEKGFGISRMRNHIQDKTGSYTHGLHYGFFLLDRNPVNEHIENTPSEENTSSDKQMYLTYFGVVKMIVSSRSPNAEKFQRWATNTLFVHQFGDQPQKDKMAAKLANIPQSQIEAVRLSTSAISCVYLKRVGTVAEVRKRVSAPIDGPDDGWVYKYGLTDDLGRRLKENRADYGGWSRTEVQVEMYQYIDTALLSKAETSIKGIFENGGMRINDAKHTELVVIPPERMRFVREKYKDLGVLFGGKSKDLIIQQEKKDMEHKIALIDAQRECDSWENKCHMKDKDNVILQKDNVILQKDNELLNLRLKYECGSVV